MDAKIKIVHISESDVAGGGSLAALRLHNAMLDIGFDSTYMILNQSILDRKDIVGIPPNKTILYSRIVFEKILDVLTNPLAGRFDNKSGWFDKFRGYGDVLKHRELIDCDIIYLHGVQGGCFSYGALKKMLALNKKTYWFLHDNSAITGGCAHPRECRKYYERCGKCPYWKGNTFYDRARNAFDRKKKIISEADNLTFIAPSRWIMDNVKKSAISKNNKVCHIPNMVNPEIYKVIDRKVSETLFSISGGKKLIGYGASGGAFTNPYKGWEYMRAAVDILVREYKRGEDIELVVFGSYYQREIAESLPIKAHFLGPLDEYSMAMMYNALDVYVMSSLAENFPQAIIESLACNVPVVAFDVGGIPDVVNENTGYLARYKDNGDLARGIDIVLSRMDKVDVRRYAEEYFTGSILRKHIEMWEDEGGAVK